LDFFITGFLITQHRIHVCKKSIFNAEFTIHCCGNLFTDLLPSGDQSPARFRVREAKATGATIIAVSCPLCAIMLEDAVKAEGLDGNLRVMELSEIVNDRIL